MNRHTNPRNSGINPATATELSNRRNLIQINAPIDTNHTTAARSAGYSNHKKKDEPNNQKIINQFNQSTIIQTHNHKKNQPKPPKTKRKSNTKITLTRENISQYQPITDKATTITK